MNDVSILQNAQDIQAFLEALGCSPCPPGFSKSFAPAAIASGVVSTLTFTIDNTANTTALTLLDFTDTLPAGVTVAPTPNAATTCTDGTVTAVAGTGTISYTGGTVTASGTCTVVADVGGTAGAHVNTSGALTSSAENSGTATATLTIVSPFADDPLIPGTTVIKAAHFIELRDRINEQLVRFSQPSHSFTNAITAGVTTMQAVDLTELYTAVNNALVAAGEPTISVPAISPGETVALASHISNLRAAVVTLEAL